MSAEILVNVSQGETRIAQLENGVLQEVHVQRDSAGSLIGNLYLARVQRVLPGMQAAFLEAGLQRTAFLHANDIVRADEPEAQRQKGIQHRLAAGQTLLVQVIKDPMGSKGARLTTDISIPSRYLVLMPNNHGVALSARIEDAAERTRLEACVSGLRAELGLTPGVIVRTAADGASQAALARDLAYLQRLWARIAERARRAEPGSLVHGDLPLVTRMLRDVLPPDLERVRIDDEAACAQMQAFARDFVPDLLPRLERYEGESPIFDLYGVEDQIEKALTPEVALRSGGTIVIQQTEAMITVDVNTGGFVGTHDPDETILKTNIEAAGAIARQLRLRNLGGIIIIDFIDMPDPAHRDQVLTALQTALDRDPAKSMVCGISQLSLVEMTRKRTRESIEHLLCETCSNCSGRGYVKTAETVCHGIFRELQRSARHGHAGEMLVLAHPDIIALMLDDLAESVATLSEALGHPVRLQAESLYQQEHFDVVLM
jgi:ribonuclease G